MHCCLTSLINSGNDLHVQRTSCDESLIVLCSRSPGDVMPSEFQGRSDWSVVNDRGCFISNPFGETNVVLSKKNMEMGSSSYF